MCLSPPSDRILPTLRFYVPGVMEILYKLVDWRDSNQVIYRLPIDRRYVGRGYGELVRDCLEQSVICLALYCEIGNEKYIFTLPPKDRVLAQNDMMYVIADHTWIAYYTDHNRELNATWRLLNSLKAWARKARENTRKGKGKADNEAAAVEENGGTLSFPHLDPYAWVRRS